MKKRPIGFKEGYDMLRKAGCDWFSCVFMATVWVLRGDLISDTKK